LQAIARFDAKHATELARAEAGRFGEPFHRQRLMEIASGKDKRVLHTIGFRIELQQGRML
jgi:hypothetical protein